MMVPVIVVMGGTFAFSAWAGNATSVFNETTATFQYSQNTMFVATNANITPLTVTGANGQISLTYASSSQLVNPTAYGSNTKDIVQYVNITNLVPGTWAAFNVTVTNDGSSTLNMSSVTIYNADTTPIQIISGTSTTVNSTTYNMNTAFMSAVTVSDAQDSMNTYSTYLGAVIGGSPGQTTVPQYLHPNQSFTYAVIVFAGYDVAPGHDIGLAIQINMASVV